MKDYIAYFMVHFLAFVSYDNLSDLYKEAISGTNGSSAFGSPKILEMLSKTKNELSKYFYYFCGSIEQESIDN